MEPTSGMSALSSQQVGHGADVVLVAVRQHDRLDVVEPVLDVVEVGQDQVDAGVVVLGEEHAAVDDEQPARVLDDGHVAADLAEPAEGDDPHAVLGQRGGVGSSGWGWLTVSPDVAETGRAAAATSGRAVASTSGQAHGGESMTPSSAQRGLGHDGPLGDVHDGVDGRHEPPVQLAGAARVARVDGGDHLGVRVARPRGRPRSTTPTAPWARWARLVASSPEYHSRSVWRMHRVAAPEVALGVLDRHDPRVLGELEQRLGA